MQQSNIRDIGPKLIDLGYQVCSLTPGKKAATYKGWNERSLTKEECLKEKPAYGVGILCGVGPDPIVCLDVDSLDAKVGEEFSQWVLDNLGFEYLLYKRIGRPPKYSLVARAEEDGWTKLNTGKWVKNGVEVQLEVINKGFQFCAYHIHPETYQPYEWPELSLLDTPACDLPQLSFKDVNRAYEAFIEIIKKHGYRPKDKKAENSRADNSSENTEEFGDDDWVLTKSELEKLTISEAKEYLMGSGIDNVNRDSWYKAGMALHHHFKGADEAFVLWDNWSSTAPNYKGVEDCRKIWDSFHLDKGNPVTIGSIIAAYQKRNRNGERRVYALSIAKKLLKKNSSTIKKGSGKKADYYRFNGRCWERCCVDGIENMLAGTIEEEYQNFVDNAVTPKQRVQREKAYIAFQKKPTSHVKEIVQACFMFSGASITVKESDFDANSRYIGVANGDIDLESGKLSEPDPSRMLSKASSVMFNAEAKCPLWEKTLKECLVYEDVVKYFQRLIGYVALGKPRENKLVFLHGYGCNGKSTVMSVLREVFGPYGVTLQPQTLVTLSDRRLLSSGGLSPDVLRLKGARLAIAEELTEGSKIKSDMLKRLAGTEELVARGLYQEAVSFSPTHTIFVCTNHLPKISDDGDGAWRRLALLEFPRSFDKDPEFKKDERLKDKLLGESSGILNWILEGVRLYKEVGLTPPRCIERAVQNWRGEEDIVGNWLEEYTERADESERLSMRDAYASFKVWCSEYGVDSQSSAWLTRRLKERGFVVKKGAKRFNYVHGVKLSTSDDALDW